MQNHLKRETNSQILYFLRRNFLGKSQVLVLLFLFTFSACQKSENVVPEVTNPKSSNARVEGKPFILKYENLHPEVKVSFVRYNSEGGYLEFSDPYIFEKLKNDLTNKNNQELSSWEGQFDGFASLRSIYENEINSEIERAKRTNFVYGDNPPKNVMQDTSHTEFVNKNRKSLVFDENGKYKMNIVFYNVASLVNEEGIVKIANYFYQYSTKQIKLLRDDPSDKSDKLKKLKDGKNTINIPIVSESDSKGSSNGRTEQVVLADLEYTNSLISLSWYYSSGKVGYSFDITNYQNPIYNIIGYNYDSFTGQYYPILQLVGYESRTSISGSFYTEGNHWLHGWTPISQYYKSMACRFTRCDGSLYTITPEIYNFSTLNATLFDGANACFSSRFVTLTNVGTTIGSPVWTRTVTF